MGKYSRYWEMRRPNALVEGGSEEAYICTHCGGETIPENGWGGSPNRHVCSHDCQMDHGDVRVGSTSSYRKNFDAIFPNSPGAGL